jgi:hypothetical protein
MFMSGQSGIDTAYMTEYSVSFALCIIMRIQLAYCEVVIMDRQLNSSRQPTTIGPSHDMTTDSCPSWRATPVS